MPIMSPDGWAFHRIGMSGLDYENNASKEHLRHRGNHTPYYIAVAFLCVSSTKS